VRVELLSFLVIACEIFVCVTQANEEEEICAENREDEHCDVVDDPGVYRIFGKQVSQVVFRSHSDCRRRCRFRVMTVKS